MSNYVAVAASLRACTDPQKRHAADVIEELSAAISKGNAWIPVSERLPSDERGWMHPVLATNGKSIFVETTHPSWWNKKDKRGREYDGPTITHWMPLPSAPEAK